MKIKTCFQVHPWLVHVGSESQPHKSPSWHLLKALSICTSQLIEVSYSVTLFNKANDPRPIMVYNQDKKGGGSKGGPQQTKVGSICLRCQSLETLHLELCLHPHLHSCIHTTQPPHSLTKASNTVCLY